MCDYSLHLVASRPANVGDKLITTDFAKSITRGFAAVGESEVAVCLVPGTELAFEDDIQYDRAFSLFGKARVNHKVARFRQVNMWPDLGTVDDEGADQLIFLEHRDREHSPGAGELGELRSASIERIAHAHRAANGQ
jgi:hypothetical protein